MRVCFLLIEHFGSGNKEVGEQKDIVQAFQEVFGKSPKIGTLEI
jgi:hypothetical protein